MKELMDFDQMFAEDVEAQPIPYKLFGVEGTIPAKIPYGLVMQYQRMSRAGNESEVSDNNVHMLLTHIFGADVIAQWEANPYFDVDKMTKVLKWAMEQYGLASKEDESPKGRKSLRVVR